MRHDPAWGTAPWDVGSPDPRPALPRACDAVVVGGGLTGLSAALHLARRGAEVVLLEASHLGAGASGRTGAIALEGTAAGVLDGVDDCLGTLARVVAEAEIACALDLGGCWELAHVPAAGAGTPLWRDGDDVLCVADTVPGGTVDAGALVRGLARAARASGAVVVEQAPVLPLGGDHTIRVAGEAHALAARQVVVATEALTHPLVPLPAGVSTALTLALATGPLDPATLAAIGLGERRPFYTSDLPYLWGRVLADGRVVFGAGLVFADGRDVRDLSISAEAARAAFARLTARVHGLHPALAAVPITHRWGGPVAFRQGGQPLCGWHPALPGVAVTGAYAGHGVALAVRVGELVAEAITDGAPLPPWGRVA